MRSIPRAWPPTPTQGGGGGGHGQWWKLHGRAVTQGKAHFSNFRMTPKQDSLGHGTRKGHDEEGTERLSSLTGDYEEFTLVSLLRDSCAPALCASPYLVAEDGFSLLGIFLKLLEAQALGEGVPSALPHPPQSVPASI